MRYLLLAAILCCQLAAGAQQLYVGTYNIRYDNRSDSLKGNGWARRCPVICAQMRFERPDVFGTQEAYAHQLRDMLPELEGYACFGTGRDNGKARGEHCAIFYRKDRLRLLLHGDFWLSETPDVPSKGWDAALPRICTWGLFKDSLTGRQFYFFNLHMDHIGVTARREGAKLVVRRIKEITGGKPVILTGDFNVDQNDEIYRIFTESGILKDSYECARHRFAENGTFNRFNPASWTQNRIDHVFVSHSFDVQDYGVLTDSYWTFDPQPSQVEGENAPRQADSRQRTRRLPSDHYPVMVRMEFGK